MENVASARERPQLDAIQACRGIAALLVVAFHLTGLSEKHLGASFAGGWFGFGWSGVDLFFVLSGFIIFYVHGRDIGRPARLRGYAWRRFARIYPLYAILTLAVLPVYLLGAGEAMKRDPGVIARSLLLLPQPFGVSPVITVGWSLNVEALFYVVFGLLIALPRRPARILFASWMALSGALALYGALTGPGFVLAHPFVAFLFDGRNLEFGLGCLCGYAIGRGAVRGAPWLLAAGVTGFVFSGANEAHLWIDPIQVRLALFGLSAAAIVAGVAALDFGRHLRVPRPLLAVGNASYSIYLTHGLALGVLVPLVNRLHLASWIGIVPTQLIAMAGALAVGFACYGLIEKPVLRRLRSTAAAPRAPAKVIAASSPPA